MALPEWPATVPHRPERGGYSVPEPHVPHRRTEFEDGFPRNRRRTTLRRRIEQMAWVWDDTELAAFEAFYFITLAEGQLRFTMFVPEGNSYIERTCKFAGKYQRAPQQLSWRVTAQLFVWS